MRRIYIPGEPARTARQEARKRQMDQDGLNAYETMEFAYSPTTGAVGLRHSPDKPFCVFNVHYPLYRKDDGVRDWVSIGCSRSIGESGPRRFHK